MAAQTPSDLPLDIGSKDAADPNPPSRRRFKRQYLLVLLVILGDLLRIIPMPALVAIMIMVSIGTFSWRSILDLRRNPWQSSVVMLATVVTVVATHDLAKGVIAFLSGGAAYGRQVTAGLVLITPWDRLGHVASHHYPWLPVRWLLRDKYDTAARLASFDRPVMVAYLMLVAFVFITINFLVDLAYVGLDPRLRKARA